MSEALEELSDPESECEDVCDKLVACENQWLEDEGEETMTESEVFSYGAECRADCIANSDREERQCIWNESCEAILDGECSN